jgi:DNA-directed RNA polymerase II subunit RPB1
LKEFEQEVSTTFSLKGFQEIGKVYTKKINDRFYEKATGEYKESKRDIWLIETDGIALSKVLTVDHVDHTRTTSNSCIEIFNVLGIEAA